MSKALLLGASLSHPGRTRARRNDVPFQGIGPQSRRFVCSLSVRHGPRATERRRRTSWVLTSGAERAVLEIDQAVDHDRLVASLDLDLVQGLRVHFVLHLPVEVFGENDVAGKFFGHALEA